MPGFVYSSAMGQLPQEWDFIGLNIFLADPKAYVPGTTMASPPVDDMETRANIAGFLKTTAGK